MEIMQTILEAENVLKKMYLETVPKDTKKLILFFIPPANSVVGGLLSILSLAKSSRKLMEKDGYFVQTCYYPNLFGFFKYRLFDNDENIITFDEVIDNFPEVEEMIIHIPEYYAGVIFRQLSEKQINFFKKSKKLRINIMNQNIELMPSLIELDYLKDLSEEISQTTAHKKYTTQEACDKWGYPLYALPAIIADARYIDTPYEEKQNIICFSNDKNPNRQEILNKLLKELPEFQLYEINNLTYNQYKELISKAKYCITFGEGFDSYFSEPIASGSISFAVYNEKFFPSAEYKKYQNVYSTYEDMLNKICEDIRFFENNTDKYKKLNKKLCNILSRENILDEHIPNLENFYYEKPLFVPVNSKNTKKENKAYYSCCSLQNGFISFYANDTIRICCASHTEEYMIAKTSDSIEKILKEIPRKKLKLIKSLKKGKIPEYCKGCFMLKKENWSEPNLNISFVNMNHFMTCNLKCKYCGNHNENWPQRVKDSNTEAVLNVLKGFMDRGVIQKSGFPIEVAGGEPSILKGIDRVIDFCIENRCHTKLHTNCTVFSESFIRGANTGHMLITLTPDAGSRDVYLKIKGVDCFDKVWGNIGKYMEATNSSENFEVKFIIQPDNLNDIENMIKMCLAKKVKTTIIDLDLTQKNTDIFLPAVKNFIELCVENGIGVKKGTFLPNKDWNTIVNELQAKGKI